jgi:hypothetical protein
LCKEIKCLFNGSVFTSGKLNKLNEIVCDSPLSFRENDLVNISIQIDNVNYGMGLGYKFLSSKTIKVTDDENNQSIIINESTRVGFSLSLFIFDLVFLYKLI